MRNGIVLPSGRITNIPGVYPNGWKGGIIVSAVAPTPPPDLPLQSIDPWIINNQFTAQSVSRIFAVGDSDGLPKLYNHGTDTLDAFVSGWGAAEPSIGWTQANDFLYLASTSSTLYGIISGDLNGGTRDDGIYSCPIGGADWTFFFSVTDFLSGAGADHGSPYYGYHIDTNDVPQLLGDGTGGLWLSVNLAEIGTEGYPTLSPVHAVLHMTPAGVWSVVWTGANDTGSQAARIAFGGPGGSYPYIVDVVASTFRVWNGSAFTDFALPLGSAAFGLFALLRSPLYIVSPTEIWYCEPVDPWGATVYTTILHHYNGGALESVSLDGGVGFVGDGNLWPIQEGVLLFGFYQQNSCAIVVKGPPQQMGPVTLTLIPLAGNGGINQILDVEEKAGSFICQNNVYAPVPVPQFVIDSNTIDITVTNGSGVDCTYFGPTVDPEGMSVASITLFPDDVILSVGAAFTANPPDNSTTAYHVEILDHNNALLWTSPTINVTTAAGS